MSLKSRFGDTFRGYVVAGDMRRLENFDCQDDVRTLKSANPMFPKAMS